MQIIVEFMAFIRRPDGIERVSEHNLDKPSSIKQFLSDLEFTMDEIRMMQFFVAPSPSKEKNVRVQRSYILDDGDYLFITLPIGGGSLC